MLRLLYACLFLCCTLNAWGNKDSLWGIWEDEAQIDTIRLEAVYDLINDYYLYESLDTSSFLVDRQLELAKAIQHLDWQSKGGQEVLHHLQQLEQSMLDLEWFHQGVA